jgi:uncharacterized membrane protein YfcA
MKEKTIISTATLLTSLVSYWYAKASTKDVAPFIMLGGFVGSIIGETIVEQIKKIQSNENTDQ